MINEGFNVNTVNGDLTDIAKQGVLLLNTVLTIPIDPHRNYGIIDAHKQIWEEFTRLLFEHLDQNQNPIAFILWGEQAQKFDQFVTNENRTVLEGHHPSPRLKGGEFFCRDYFTGTNEFLRQAGRNEINWSVLAKKGRWEWDHKNKMSVFSKTCSGA